jgi:hypothetical protein
MLSLAELLDLPRSPSPFHIQGPRPTPPLDRAAERMPAGLLCAATYTSIWHTMTREERLTALPRIAVRAIETVHSWEETSCEVS